MKGKLKFKVRVTPVSPVHIGVGTRFLARSGYHLDEETKRAFPLRGRRIAEALLDAFGHLPNATALVRERLERDELPPAIVTRVRAPSSPLALREISVHAAALAHLRGTGPNDGLKEAATLGSGLPYIPGSSVKGAFRTVWLDWLLSQGSGWEAARGFLSRDVQYHRKDRADDPFMERLFVASQLAGASGKSQPQNRDVFRAVQVSDLVPRLSRPTALTGAFSVLALSYQVDGFARRADGDRARPQAWECLRPGANVPYEGTVTVDLDLLERVTLDPIARRLVAALARPETWADALHNYGQRVFGQEIDHYENLLDLPQASRGVRLDELWNFVNAEDKVDPGRLFPLGMGTGLLAKSLVGIVSEESVGTDAPVSLGQTTVRDGTAMASVLALGKRTSGYQGGVPAPKSCRVVGKFIGNDLTAMSADRPLGWTHLDLTPQ